MRNRTGASVTPSALQPYICGLQKGSLILLTHVLNATNSWMILRYLDVQLARQDGEPKALNQDNEHAEDTFVIFASILRSWEFWQEGSRRLGRNLMKSRQNGDLVYIDGLTSLCMDISSAGRGVGVVEGSLTLTDPSANGLEESLKRAIATRKQSRPEQNVTVIIDGLDFLLASQYVGMSALRDVVGYLRSAGCSVILSISADNPMVHSPSTPLECDHIALLATLAHQADYTIGTRLLSTGVAKDVTGVLRITRGSEDVDEKELLYFLGGDGTVNVFERGSASAA